MFDLLIKGGKAVTGAGNPWFRADVAVEGGRIVEVGRVSGGAREELDASGMVVCPGFIDPHDHSDWPILVNRLAENKVRMGVSTIAFPSCGNGAAPLNDEMREEIGRSSPVLMEAGVEVDWSTVDEYLTMLEEGGISVNVAPQVGFGTVRRYVMGMEMRAPTAGELGAMKAEVAKAMEAGCRGITTGLRYDPQSYAETGEVIELTKVVARYGGYYTSHIRDEGDRGDPVGAVEEIIRIGEEAGLPVRHRRSVPLQGKRHGARRLDPRLGERGGQGGPGEEAPRPGGGPEDKGGPCPGDGRPRRARGGVDLRLRHGPDARR